MNLRTIAIYTEPDAASIHVHLADEAVLLSGTASKAYIDGYVALIGYRPSAVLLTACSDQIVDIAKKHNVDAIIPGYGFLSENSDFARAVTAAGMVFAGPSPESIEAFGLKHTARELATKAGVPIVPGTKELVQSEDDAVQASKELGFPVFITHILSLCRGRC